MRHGDWYPDRVLRLFRRGAGRFSDDLVHERLVVDGPISRLEGELLHDSMPTLDNALEKMNRYTSGRPVRRRLSTAGGPSSVVICCVEVFSTVAWGSCSRSTWPRARTTAI
jgi:hypothetical protein